MGGGGDAEERGKFEVASEMGEGDEVAVMTLRQLVWVRLGIEE
jgi:hypothetical protein